MGRLTIKQWVAVVATAVAVTATGVSANMIWDSEVNGTSNATLWDSYAYYYLEGYYNTKEGGVWPNHHMPCFATKTCRADDNEANEQILSAKSEADADGEWPYAAQSKGERAFYMNFKGLSGVSTDYSINPEAGMGLLLSAKAGGDNPQGIGEGFEKVTEIKWRMKLSAEIKQIRFKIETTKTSKKPAAENAFGKVFENTTPGQWMTCSVKLTPVASGCETLVGKPADGPPWADGDANKPWGKGGVFDVTKCKVGDLTLADYFGGGYKYDGKEATKIAWQVATGGMMPLNSSLTAGEVWVDKVEIVGFDYTAPDICKSCVGAPTVAAPSGAWKLSDLEPGSTDFAELAQNAIGQYWYYYNDVQIGGTSDATGGIKEDEYSPTGYSLDIADNGKGYNSTNGAWISYQLGNAVEKDGNTVAAFVGLGTEVFHCPGDPDAAKVLYNAGSDAGAGVYFLYRTNFDDKGYLSFEAHDEYAYNNPDGGEVYGVRLPGTKGDWKSATIKFSDMKLPSWAPKDRTGTKEPFDKSKIAKFQFKVDGVQSGDFAIDNLYIKGTESPKGNCKPSEVPPAGVKYYGKKAAAAGLRATYSRGMIGVNWNSAANIANGKVALVNTKGRVVASAPVSAVGSKITAKLGTGNIPTGMYFVRVTAKDVNGKRIVQQTPVSIVK